MKIQIMELNLFVVTWRGPTGKVWESERCTYTAKEALQSFRRDAVRLKGPIVVLGVRDADEHMQIRLVQS